MTMLTRAALAAATLALAAAPAAEAAITPPPTDAAGVSFGNGCNNEDPCDPLFTGPRVSVDRTYPSRLVAWAEGVLP